MWQKLSEKLILNHPRMRVMEDQVRLPNGTITDYVRFDGENRGVTIICIVDGKLLVEKEYSYPPNEIMYQLPGGGAYEHETLEEAARREFAEECKFQANDLTQIGWFYTNNRRSKSKMYVFVATDITRDARFEGDEEEDIRLEWIPAAEVPGMIRDGKIVNHAMLAAWAMWQSRQ